MVIVKNIKIDDDVFSFDYYPEGKESKGCFKYNRKTNEIVEHIKSKENEWDAYLKHAYLVIEKGQEIPETLMSAWY